MKHLTRFLAMALLLLSHSLYAQLCTNDDRFTEAEFFSPSQIDSTFNVRYATVTDYQGNTLDLELDVFYPKPGQDPLQQRPFVMTIHGGGFKNGTRQGHHRYCREFAKRGFVAATISYRLGYNQSDPANQLLAMYRAQQDANAALRFVVQNANRARINTDWMFTAGSSAGAITALNVVYLDESDWETEVPGITTLEGPLNSSGNNLNNTFSIKGVFNNWGMVFDSGIDAQEMVPTIAFHGALDNTTPIGTGPRGPGSPIFSGSGSIHSYLLANNVCSELTVDPNGGHGIYNSGSGQVFRVSRAACFFKSLFCNNCTSNYFTQQVLPSCAPVTSTKIDGLEARQEFTVFPNPIRDRLHFRSEGGAYRVELMNAAGQVVRRLEEAREGSIEVTDLAAGIYVLRAMDLNHQTLQIKKVRID